jgi:hypothetical protein
VQVKFAMGAVLAALLAGNPAFGADTARPDPVLQGSVGRSPEDGRAAKRALEPGSCIAALEGPDYVPGVDASGQPVARADIGAERVPVPGDILVPLPNSGPNRAGRGGRGVREPAYMTLGRDRVDRLVNPESCPPEPVAAKPGR